MVNTCKSAQGSLCVRSQSGCQALAKRHSGQERGFNGAASWMIAPPVYKQAPNLTQLWRRNVETPYSSCRREIEDEWTCRKVGRSVCGLGMSEKAKAVL